MNKSREWIKNVVVVVKPPKHLICLLHLLPFQTPTKSAVLSGRGVAFSALQMQKGVKTKELCEIVVNKSTFCYNIFEKYIPKNIRESIKQNIDH